MPDSISIIDSHIHLWPASIANEQGYVWMTPGMPLAKQHLLSDYAKAINSAEQRRPSSKSSTRLKGAIFVETDVRYSSPSTAQDERNVQTWAAAPLDEISFLRDLKETQHSRQAVDHSSRASGFDPVNLLALVPWAPLHLSPSTLITYLDLAESRAGPTVWPSIKGFRFLLQGITPQQKFDTLVDSKAFLENLRILGDRGFSFDVAVDQRSGGIWQLEGFVRVLETQRTQNSSSIDENGQKSPIFVVNHLCKPDFGDGDSETSIKQDTETTESAFQRWSNAIASMASFPNVYMKLSGAFSELPPRVLEPTSKDSASHATAIAASLKPWVAHVLRVFGPSRVMYGSDWPVCNLKGPGGEEKAWGSWRDVVECILDDPDYGLTDDQKEWIWWRTAAEAYRLE